MSHTSAVTVDDPEMGQSQTMQWQSAHGWRAPSRIESISQAISADRAYQQTSQGVGLLWLGDYHQGRELLQSLKRRINQRTKSFEHLPWPQRLHALRQQRSQTARAAGLLLVKVQPGFVLKLARAPEIGLACQMAYGERLAQQTFVVPLTELMGVLSAYQWYDRGLPLAQLGQSIHPRWGVFAPTRNEYLELVAQAPLPQPCQRAADIGTGTGVLALILAKRGVPQVLATDLHPAALACAQDNVKRLGLENQVEVCAHDLLPPGKFDLLVCNPPWLPGAASSALEAAVYDPDHRMLRGFLQKARDHMNPNAQAWLILSDLAEHMQLRTREQLLGWISTAGLQVLERIDIKPSHNKLARTDDPMHALRGREVTSLWRLSFSV